jgi:hypothetical protein
VLVEPKIELKEKSNYIHHGKPACRSSADSRHQRLWAATFPVPELTAGLRQHTADPALSISLLVERDIPFSRPSVGYLRGLQVTCKNKKSRQAYNLVYKQSHGTTRKGLSGAGLREILFYRNLASQVPLATPKLIASHNDGEWLVLEMVHALRGPEQWTSTDYLTAVEGLVALHERFWGLRDHLETYHWLPQPLDADFDIHQTAAKDALQNLSGPDGAAQISRDQTLMNALYRLTENATAIVDHLHRIPATLLHCDYWPGNLAITSEQLYAFDWQQVSIGPGTLDLVTLLQNSLWWFKELPLSAETLVGHYREVLYRLNNLEWTDDEWSALWDYSLMWVFLSDWLPLLARIPSSILSMRFAEISSLWLQPVSEAVTRHLGE